MLIHQLNSRKTARDKVPIAIGKGTALHRWDLISPLSFRAGSLSPHSTGMSNYSEGGTRERSLWHLRFSLMVVLLRAAIWHYCKADPKPVCVPWTVVNGLGRYCCWLLWNLNRHSGRLCHWVFGPHACHNSLCETELCGSKRCIPTTSLPAIALQSRPPWQQGMFNLTQSAANEVILAINYPFITSELMIIVPDCACHVPWAVTGSRAEAAQSFSHSCPKATLQYRNRPINSFINSSIKCPSSAVKFVGVQSPGSHFSLLCCSSFLTNLLWDFTFTPRFLWEDHQRFICFTLEYMFTGQCGSAWEHTSGIVTSFPPRACCEIQHHCVCTQCPVTLPVLKPSLLTLQPAIPYWHPLPWM